MAYKLPTIMAVADVLTVLANTTASFTATCGNCCVLATSSSLIPVTAVTSTNGVTFTKLDSSE